jgi:hypothetical protein
MNNFATANNPTAARSVGRVVPTQEWLGWAASTKARFGVAGWVRRGTTARGKPTLAGQRQARPDTMWRGWAAHCRKGEARHGRDWQRRQGTARQRSAWQSNAGLAWPRSERQGYATQARRIRARRGLAGQRNAGTVWHGEARHARSGNAGMALQGRARRGLERHGNAGQAGLGGAWRRSDGRGSARHYTTQTGGRGRGKNCVHLSNNTQNQCKTT